MAGTASSSETTQAAPSQNAEPPRNAKETTTERTVKKATMKNTLLGLQHVLVSNVWLEPRVRGRSHWPSSGVVVKHGECHLHSVRSGHAHPSHKTGASSHRARTVRRIRRADDLRRYCRIIGRRRHIHIRQFANIPGIVPDPRDRKTAVSIRSNRVRGNHSPRRRVTLRLHTKRIPWRRARRPGIRRSEDADRLHHHLHAGGSAFPIWQRHAQSAVISDRAGRRHHTVFGVRHGGLLRSGVQAMDRSAEVHAIRRFRLQRRHFRTVFHSLYGGHHGSAWRVPSRHRNPRNKA